MDDLEIRIARDEADRAAVYNLRYELYVVEQGLFGDTADHERRWLREPIDEHAALFVVEKGGEIVGTLRLVWGGEGRFDHEIRETFDVESFTDIVDESEIAVASRALVRPAFRQSRLPLMLFMAGMAELVARGTELLLGECEPHLLNTWERIGLRPFGLAEHPINGTLVRLALVCGDLDYQRSIKSLLVPVVERWTKVGYTPRRLAARLSKRQRVVGEAKDRAQFWARVEETLPLDRFAKLLGGLSPTELDAVLGNSYALDCDAGSVLIRKGHASRTLYILLTGTLEVRDGARQVAEVTEPGAIVGEVAFFSGTPRMSDVNVGSAGARVLALSERNLKQLISLQGAGAAKFLLTMTQGLCKKLHERAADQPRG
jgi:hypothetical protein